MLSFTLLPPTTIWSKTIPEIKFTSEFSEIRPRPSAKISKTFRLCLQEKPACRRDRVRNRPKMFAICKHRVLCVSMNWVVSGYENTRPGNLPIQGKFVESGIFKMVIPAGFEPTACRLGGDRSILLSYGTIWLKPFIFQGFQRIR